MIEKTFYIGLTFQMDGVGVCCCSEKDEKIVMNHLWTSKQPNLRNVAENLKSIVDDIIKAKVVFEEENNLKNQKMFIEIVLTTNSSVVKKLNFEALTNDTLIDFAWNVRDIKIPVIDAISLVTSCINEGRLSVTKNIKRELELFNQQINFIDKEKILPLPMTLAMSIGVLEYQKLLDKIY